MVKNEPTAKPHRDFKEQDMSTVTNLHTRDTHHPDEIAAALGVNGTTNPAETRSLIWSMADKWSAQHKARQTRFGTTHAEFRTNEDQRALGAHAAADLYLDAINEAGDDPLLDEDDTDSDEVLHLMTIAMEEILLDAETTLAWRAGFTTAARILLSRHETTEN